MGMPAAEVPTPKSPEVEPGQLTKGAGRVGLSNLSDRIAKIALSLTLLGGLLVLGGCSATLSASPPTSNAATSSKCARNPPRLTPVTSSSLSTLPPSHDNDVGARRMPDAHPDADVDANQEPKAGPCHKS
jgi:hypothetical protein